ncbi:MAG: trimeric intracellular cation channel family protein [Saprospiraceae bacterium]|nr:trimeric intracellular cation channel family protein [Saprospiraceae bacterium]
MDIIYFFDLAGTFVFAISGALTAIQRKLDIFGSCVIALVTALGGGTLRDILIGRQPVGWLLDNNYLLIIAAGIAVSYIFGQRVQKLRKTLFLFDTIGIGLYTILGLERTLGLGLSMPIAVIMGTVSAVFGGVIRDVLCNEVPLIFRKEIYATACIAGGILFLILTALHMERDWAMLATVFFIIVLRTLAVKYKWHLPSTH